MIREQKDSLAQQELSITPITFGDLAQELLQELRSKNPGINPALRTHFYNLYLIEEAILVPCLRASFRPALGRSSPKVDLLIGANRPIRLVTNLYNQPKDQGNPSHPILYVLNLPPWELEEPTVTEELLFLKPQRVQIAPDIDTAVRIGGWVIDPLIRRRIEEYSWANRRLVRKYRSLRLAPFIKHSDPQRDIFSVADIRRLARGEKIKGARIRFTPEDIEWLETHMDALGLKLPTA